MFYIGIFPSQGFFICIVFQKPLTWEDVCIDVELCVRFNYIFEEKSLFVYGYLIFVLLVSENVYFFFVYFFKLVSLI